MGLDFGCLWVGRSVLDVFVVESMVVVGYDFDLGFEKSHVYIWLFVLHFYKTLSFLSSLKHPQ